MGLILELGILAAFNLGNSPYEKKEFQQPYVLIEKSLSENYYFKVYNSSRTQRESPTNWNPQTGLWQVGAGYNFKVDNQIFKFEAGHISEHEVGSFDKNTESYDYAKISYRIEY